MFLLIPTGAYYGRSAWDESLLVSKAGIDNENEAVYADNISSTSNQLVGGDGSIALVDESPVKEVHVTPMQFLLLHLVIPIAEKTNQFAVKEGQRNKNHGEYYGIHKSGD